MEGQKEASTFLIMLQLLKRYGVTDSVLQRKYKLNRATLHKVRKGEDLSYSHEHYFNILLSALNLQRRKYYDLKNEKEYRLIKDTMFEVMLREHIK